MNFVCLRCGLPLHMPESGKEVHERRFPGQEALAAELSFGCLFHMDAGGLSLCARTQEMLPARMDVPEHPVLLGPVPSAVQHAEDSTWIPFRNTGRMLLLEHRLSPLLPAAELLWSWFKHLLLALEALHAMGFAHGRVEKNMIWVEQSSAGEVARVNQVRLLTPWLPELDGDSLRQAQDEDVRSLASLFLPHLQSIDTWHRGLDEFRELCAALVQNPGERQAILSRVAAAHRMAQLAISPEDLPQPKSQWKKPALLFASLFLMSIFIAWMFSGTSKKASQPPPAAERKRPSPPAEAVVEISRLRWNPDFPLHRVPLDDDVLLYLAPRQMTDAEDWMHFLAFAGIIPPRPPDRNAENFFSFRLDPTTWRPRPTLLMKRSPKSEEPQRTAPAQVTEWIPLLGKGFPLKPDAISPPPVLLTEPGELLTLVGYTPENTEQERLILVLRPPSRQAPSRTLWTDWLGGILPSYCVWRLDHREELRASLSFERAADARDAARFLENVWRLSGRNPRDLMEVHDRRVRVVIPRTLVRDALHAAKPEDVPASPPPAMSSSPAPAPLPADPPDASDVSGPVRVPTELLPIPEL